MPQNVFITGGTGYMGRGLVTELIDRGCHVRALVRAGSEPRLPPGCEPIRGDALDASTYARSLADCQTFVHLVGVSHPGPAKAAQFRSIDLASVQAAVPAAAAAGIRHFVYVSVAHPAPVMKAYIQARSEAEELIRTSGMHATILRPWYVLGPGHRWPLLLVPAYWLMERLPATRDSARRLGLVTHRQMIQALVAAVETPATQIRIVEVPEIRRASRLHISL